MCIEITNLLGLDEKLFFKHSLKVSFSEWPKSALSAGKMNEICLIKRFMPHEQNSLPTNVLVMTRMTQPLVTFIRKQGLFFFPP